MEIMIQSMKNEVLQLKVSKPSRPDYKLQQSLQKKSPAKQAPAGLPAYATAAQSQKRPSYNELLDRSAKLKRDQLSKTATHDSNSSAGDLGKRKQTPNRSMESDEARQIISLNQRKGIQAKKINYIKKGPKQE